MDGWIEIEGWMDASASAQHIFLDNYLLFINYNEANNDDKYCDAVDVLFVVAYLLR